MDLSENKFWDYFSTANALETNRARLCCIYSERATDDREIRSTMKCQVPLLSRRCDWPAYPDYYPAYICGRILEWITFGLFLKQPFPSSLIHLRYSLPPPPGTNRDEESFSFCSLFFSQSQFTRIRRHNCKSFRPTAAALDSFFSIWVEVGKLSELWVRRTNKGTWICFILTLGNTF